METRDGKIFAIQKPDSILSALLNHASDCILICNEGQIEQYTPTR
jgi:hypothetical protein